MIDVDWAGAEANPHRILIPRADMPVVQASPEVRELDVDQFRLDLRSAEAAPAGAPFPDTHRHETESTLSGQTFARKVEILPPYLVEFEDGQYSVRTSGANHNILDRKVTNQVSLVAFLSSGLINAPELQVMAYEDGAVLVDPTNSTGKAESGTSPIGTIGTRRRPLDNLADALVVADELGITKIKIIGGSSGSPVQVPAGDFQNKVFVGDSDTSTFVEVLSAAQVTNTRWRDMDLRGEFDGFAHVERCVVRDITMVEGVVQHARLRGTIGLTGTGQFSLLSCVDDLAGLGTPAIDWASADIDVLVRGYRGGLGCRNRTNSKNVSIDGTLRLTLESSFAGGGAVVVRGTGPPVVEQNPSPAYTLTEQLVSPTAVAEAIQAIGGLSTDQAQQLLELYELAGLDPSKPLVVTDTSRKVPADGSSIDQSIDDASGAVTVQRQ